MDSNRSKCWAIKGSKPIKFTSGSKAKINIGGFYTENGDFYWYDLGIKQNTDSYLKSETFYYFLVFNFFSNYAKQ